MYGCLFGFGIIGLYSMFEYSHHNYKINGTKLDTWNFLTYISQIPNVLRNYLVIVKFEKAVIVLQLFLKAVMTDSNSTRISL